MAKLILTRVLYLSLLFTFSCGPDDDSSGGIMEEEQEESEEDTGTSIDLFKSWRRVDGLFTFDLSGTSFNNPRGRIFQLNSGELCRCTVVVSGTQTSGEIRIASCSYAGGGFGDPDCAGIWENNGLPYSYTKSNKTLQICEAPATCRNYR